MTDTMQREAGTRGAARTRAGGLATVARLALADLRHEWLLNLCVVLALAAVLAPLLLLFGLKSGVITILQSRLVQDPVYREIKPAETETLNDAWFAAMAERPEVAFVLPTILRGSSIVRVEEPDGGQSRAIDLIPTASGDPLLIENGTMVPGVGEAVMSKVAADAFGVAAGDTVTMLVTRTRDGRREEASVSLQLVGVLPAKADGLERVYAPLDLVRDVEAYREGRAVPDRGWDGGLPKPTPLYDGAFVLVPERLDPVTRQSLVIGTGFVDVETIEPGTMRNAIGVAPTEPATIYRVSVLRDPVGPASLRNLRNRLRGRGSQIVPYVDGLELALADRSWPLAGITLSDEEAARFGLPATPWAAPADPAAPPPRLVLLPETAGPTPREPITVSVPTMLKTPAIPLTVAQGQAPEGIALVSSELAGVLRAGTMRELGYDERAEELLLARSPYRGFRLYARTIDDVGPLFRALQEQNINAIAEIEEIERIRILDQGLSTIFWLIAAVGIAGGIAALVSSLQAAVERKTRDISMMRLLGIPRARVFFFPICQSAAVAVLACATALGTYAVLASIINDAFAADILLFEAGARNICELAPETLALSIAAALLAAILSALAAAWRTTRIEPGEAIRVE